MDDAAFERLRDFIVSPENHCFVCGPGNRSGLNLHFDFDGKTVRAQFTPNTWQRGWQHAVHGGILAAVLDETMAYVLVFAGYQAVTARLDVRFRLPVNAGETLHAEGKIVRDSRRVADLESQLVRDDAVVATATGRFFKIGDLGSLRTTEIQGDDKDD